MMKGLAVVFFLLWAFLWVVSTGLLAWNVDWIQLTWGTFAFAVVVLIMLGILHILIMEWLAMSLMTIGVHLWKEEPRAADGLHLKLLMNYNLLATHEADIRVCFHNMYTSYMQNLGIHMSAVLVSATNDDDLRAAELFTREVYRRRIYKELEREGINYLTGKSETIDAYRKLNLWDQIAVKNGMAFISNNLQKICEKGAGEFMVIHRKSRVLRKCGQYQDLMLLCAGYTDAFTYCDTRYAGKHARFNGEDTFQESDDVNHIKGMTFDYTLVLDGDTLVPEGAALKLLDIAAFYSDAGIIQPHIKLAAGKWDTMYMNIEKIRQKLSESLNEAMMIVLGECGFYGKALIKNSVYIDKVIGTPEHVLEMIPADVLSHDTYEATILQPIYASSVSLIESPPYNYLSWNSRLRRWNTGDMINGCYLYEIMLGIPIGLMRRLFQCGGYEKIKPRYRVKRGFISTYVASRPIRDMFIKQFWTLYVIVHSSFIFATHYSYIPFLAVLAIILVVSKMGVLIHCRWALLLLIPELITSILQFTPEIVVGCVRSLRVHYALFSGNTKWVPQRQVERAFETSHIGRIWLYSAFHLWGYSLFAALAICGMLILNLYNYFSSASHLAIYFMLVCIFILPIYCFITSLRLCPCGLNKRRYSRHTKEDFSSFNAGGRVWRNASSFPFGFVKTTTREDIDDRLDGDSTLDIIEERTMFETYVQNDDFDDDSERNSAQDIEIEEVEVVTERIIFGERGETLLKEEQSRNSVKYINRAFSKSSDLTPSEGRTKSPDFDNSGAADSLSIEDFRKSISVSNVDTVHIHSAEEEMKRISEIYDNQPSDVSRVEQKLHNTITGNVEATNTMTKYEDKTDLALNGSHIHQFSEASENNFAGAKDDMTGKYTKIKERTRIYVDSKGRAVRERVITEIGNVVGKEPKMKCVVM